MSVPVQFRSQVTARAAKKCPRSGGIGACIEEAQQWLPLSRRKTEVPAKFMFVF